MGSKRKGNRYLTTYLEWSEFRSLTDKLRADGDIMNWALLVLGTFWALRVNDLASVKWSDVLTEDGGVRDGFEVVEQKTKHTKKHPREITITEDAKIVIRELQKAHNKHLSKTYLFSANGWKPLSYMTVNRRLKKLFADYDVNYPDDYNVSSHLFRKTFGRYFWELSGKTESSLIYLQLTFRHTSLALTMIYLGIQKSEIQEVYAKVGFLGLQESNR